MDELKKMFEEIWTICEKIHLGHVKWQDGYGKIRAEIMNHTLPADFCGKKDGGK